MSQISSFLTGLIARKSSETTNKRKSLRSRILNLEALESRELLDAAPIAGLDAASIKDSPAILCDNLLDDTAPIDLSNVESESTTWIVTSAEDTESEGSLRYAINHVQDGDTITFDAALKGKTITINPNLGELVLNKSVTIDATSVSDAAFSKPGITISGQEASGILRLASPETGGAIDLVINWVVFADGKAENGAAINLDDVVGNSTFNNCVFDSNVADWHGGAIYTSNAALNINNCMFDSNYADESGGAICVGGDMTLNDCEFYSNSAGEGGAIGWNWDADAPNATINNCTFIQNFADGSLYDGLGEAGAIDWYGSLTINGGEFTGNYASLGAGAILSAGDSLRIENVVFNGNIAQGQEDGAGYGGAISFYGEEAALTNCVFESNYALPGCGGAIYTVGNKTALTNCVVKSNWGGYGGAIYATGAQWGTDVDGELTLTNCTILHNGAVEQEGQGGGVYVGVGCTLTAYNTILCGNEATDSGADVYVAYEQNDKGTSRGLAYGHNTLSSFTSWNDGSNNLTYDATKPLFTDEDNDDFTLASNSQAIDKGNVAYVATEVDLAGNPRVSGATVDLGAYEFQASSEPEVLSTPANPRVTAKTDTSVTVAWDAVENASQYGLIYKKSTDDSYTVVKLDAGTTSYKLTDLDSAAKYYWKVRALGDGADYLNSGYVPTQTIRWNEPVKLSTPANLRVTAKTDTSITVEWDAAENASQYGLIYRKTTDSSYTVVKLDADTTSYTLADLDSASKYYWKVRALGDGYEYLNSDYAPTQTIKWEDPVKLLTPANPRVTSKTAAGVTVEWDAVENASQYGLIYRKTTDSSYTVVKLDVDTTSYTLADLDKTAKYYWKVRALGDGYEYLNSDYVPTQTIKTVNAPVWNLADYPQYKSFKLDATTDSKYTATLYGLEKDGETYTTLQEWDYIGADAAAIVTGRNSVAETLWVTDQAASLLGEIQFNGGESLLDTLQVDGTAGDDEVAISTETVVGASNKKTTYGVVDLNGTPVKFLGASSVALNLDSGDDVIKIDALQYNYAINSTDGANALDFSGASKGLSLDLGVTERQVSLVGDGGTLQLSGDYTTVIGTSKNDRIVGTKAGLTFVGIGGSDSVTLVGGDNNVELNGARQSVTARGDGEYFVAIQNGKGSVVSADGVTKRGHVVVDADGANTTISGGQGALDAVVRGRYATVNAGATTRSTVFIEGKNASVTTGGGDDCVDVVGDYATVTTNGGADYVSITGADSNVHLGQGDDSLFLSDGDSGRVGNHHVWGDAGNDAIFAANTAGENYFYAGAGNDVLVGGAGKDYLYADLGNNVLVGLGGVDQIFGAAGRDLLIGSTTDGAQIEAMNQLEFEEFYAALYQAWDVDGDMDATVALLGEHCVSDAAKDRIYRGGGKNNLVYASELDSDFEDALEKSPYNDELKLD